MKGEADEKRGPGQAAHRLLGVVGLPGGLRLDGWDLQGESAALHHEEELSCLPLRPTRTTHVRDLTRPNRQWFQLKGHGQLETASQW